MVDANVPSIQNSKFPQHHSQPTCHPTLFLKKISVLLGRLIFLEINPSYYPVSFPPLLLPQPIPPFMDVAKRYSYVHRPHHGAVPSP